MATKLMARSQIMSSTAMPSSAGAAKSGANVAPAAGLRPLPSSATLRRSANCEGLELFASSKRLPAAARRLTQSVLGSPQVDQADLTRAAHINAVEALIEKLAPLGAANDSELHKMSDLVDRLFLWDDVSKLSTKQTFTVYEMNEFDQDSPAVLELSRQSVNKIDPETGPHIKAVGDQVPFTNKLYDPNLTMRLGITTGICLHMRNYPGRGAPELHQLPFFTPDRYETIMSWNFGNLGHICGMGPFINFQDTLLGITGGTGFFAEAKGVARLHPITPFKSMYAFTISGIPELPNFLRNPLVPPHFGVESHPDASQCKTGNALPNYTD